MRADRLVATLLLMQAQGHVTAQEVAAEADVPDPARWTAPSRAATTPEGITDAVVQRRKVRLSYRGWNRTRVEGLCDLWGLVEKNAVW
ncbi:hypothetical protein [Cryobacterium serini]|uniref:Uncharacterized protein n=1 Tax=Cryobacterium serini TaxID=1259201 RepID=A0A4R9BQF1_9MICO|nr:hypothetical protein [Cryobacterium serini]TFD88926.1 hypothetical protein E3T51_06255 [Cryobacterium serini]